MSRLVCLLFVVMISAAPAVAQEWPAEAKMQMEAAGARLSAATTTAERVEALRQIETIAAAYPDAPGARLIAVLMSEKATMEAGPGVMLDALGELAASGQITDMETYAGIVGPLLDSVAKMQENNTLLPEMAIQLDDAVQKLNSAATKAGLRSIADAISQVTGDARLGSAITESLGRLANLAKTARASPDLATMNIKATEKYIDNFIGMLPPGAGPAITGPSFVHFRKSLAWNNEMFGQSSKALNLVADAIETGQLDHAAYNEIRDRLNVLSKGPWGGDTAKDFFKKLCSSMIPIAGAWCSDAFKLAEELISGIEDSGLTETQFSWVLGTLYNPNDGECATTGKHLIFWNRWGSFRIPGEEYGWMNKVIVPPGGSIELELWSGVTATIRAHVASSPTDPDSLVWPEVGIFFLDGPQEGWWGSINCKRGTGPIKRCDDGKGGGRWC